MSTAIVWFRRDLRTTDHAALALATRNHDKVVGVFCFQSVFFTNSHASAKRSTYLLAVLKQLQHALDSLGIPFVFIEGKAETAIASLCKTLLADSLYYTVDYAPAALERDRAVTHHLETHHVQVIPVDDQLILSPSKVLKADNTPYKQFTSFKKAWLLHLSTVDLSQVSLRERRTSVDPQLVAQSKKLFDHYQKQYGSADLSDSPFSFQEDQAIARLQHFLATQVDTYHLTRDVPALAGTSLLSAYLKFGVLSIRMVLRLLLHSSHATHLSSLSTGKQVWLSELIWREFYHSVFYHFPYSAESSFIKKFDAIRWENNPAFFQAWCEGKTGFPLVDAGMRQLVTTGYLHNRLRMIVASFLCKDLLIDWKWGEAFFATQLIDYDPASNVGGWQWAAGTGTDAQPYFRIFNPKTQQEKYDPKFEFIHQWVPEYGTPEYPAPIVDHSLQRAAALAMYSVR